MPLLISRFLNVRLSRRLFTTVIVVFVDGHFIPILKVTVFTSRRNRMSSPRPRRYCTPTKSGSAPVDLARVRIVIRRKVHKSTVCSCRRVDTCRSHGYTRASLSNMSISRFLDVRFLRRYFTAVILRLRSRSLYTFTRGRSKTRQQGIGDASLGSRFYVLAR